VKTYTKEKQLEIYKQSVRQLYEFLEQNNVAITYHRGIGPATTYKFQYSVEDSSYMITAYSTGLIEVGNNLTFDLRGCEEELKLYDLCQKLYDEDEARKEILNTNIKMDKLRQVFGITVDE